MGKKAKQLPSNLDISLRPSNRNHLAALSNDSKIFALVNPALQKDNLVCYQPENGSIKASLSISETPTSLAWFNRSNSLLVGSKNGSVSVYHTPFSLQHQQSLDVMHPAPVTSLAIQKDDSLLASAAGDSQVIVWNLKENSLCSKWSSPEPVHCVQFGSEGHLITASSAIKVWNLSSKECILSLSCHASNVFQLLYVPERKVCLTLAMQDRFINITKCSSKNNSKKSAFQALALDSRADHVSVSKTQDVLAIDENGVVHIWKSPIIPKSKNPTVQTTKIQFVSSLTDSTIIPIIYASFLDLFQRSKLLLAYGSLSSPSFEYLDYENSEGNLIPDQTLKRDKNISRDGSNQLDLSTVSYQESAEAIGKNIPDQVDVEMEPSFEDLLNASELQNALPVEPEAEKTLQHASSSLLSMLVQGLKTGDQSLLQLCFSPSHPLDSVKSTLKDLPREQLFPLLNEIMKLFNNDKGHGAPHLIRWIQHLFIIHAGFLLTVRHLENKLQGLHGVLSNRLKSYSKLMNLKGRLDMLEAQIEMYRSPVDFSATPVVSLNEKDVEEVGFEDMADFGFEDKGLSSESEEDNHASEGSSEEEEEAIEY